MKYIIITSFLIVVIFSCNNSGGELMKNVTGKPGEILVIIEDNAWNTRPGEELRSSLASFQPALQQDESMFKLINITPSSFNDFFRSNRNIIYINPCESSGPSSIKFRNDVWAKPQVYVEITAPGDKQLAELIYNNKDTILSFFIVSERKRLQETYKTFCEKEIIQKLSAHNISLVIPKGYKLVNDTAGFVRISSEAPAINLGILIYEFDYSDTVIFTNEFILGKRDSILKIFMPGTTPGNWMITEHSFPVTNNTFILENRPVYEVRGQWKILNNFMNGPFISLTTTDEKRKKVITAEGFVYAPKSDKLGYIRQMEAILYTLKITD